MRKSMPTVLIAILGLLATVIAVQLFLTRHREESPQELVELALHGGGPAEQEQAATRLEALAGKAPGTESRNAVQPYLVRMLNESDNPGVRAAAMRGLATIWDYECMPKILDSLEDPSLQVRQTAARVVAKLTEFDPRFDANAPNEQRAETVKKMRDAWKRFQDRTLKNWQRSLQEKDGKP
jgi:HEAT repeat protein